MSHTCHIICHTTCHTICHTTCHTTVSVEICHTTTCQTTCDTMCHTTCDTTTCHTMSHHETHHLSHHMPHHLPHHLLHLMSHHVPPPSSTSFIDQPPLPSGTCHWCSVFTHLHWQHLSCSNLYTPCDHFHIITSCPLPNFVLKSVLCKKSHSWNVRDYCNVTLSLSYC